MPQDAQSRTKPSPGQTVRPDPERYRPNVGLALFHAKGLVFLGRRIGEQGQFIWQMPQGGVDPGEAPTDAAYRELQEEIGVTKRHVQLLEETPDWLYYDFPPELVGRNGRRFLGQRQKWFAFRFTGRDADIHLDLHTPEFSEWRWARLEEAPQLVIPFKRPVYDEVAHRFARFTRVSGA
jgi:putative (di)nucleoside polyphosphate hydrolase